jgi:ATP-dependent exoDNAse (exonuclease V) beta subunit
VASYISEADEDLRAREAEETKRLLYVALTRARDALYLVTVTKDGEMRPARGSLGEVLPESIRGLFAATMGSRLSIEWHAPSGRVHALRVVQAEGDVPSLDASISPESRNMADAFGPLGIRAEVPRVAATTFASRVAGSLESSARPFGTAGDLVVGTLVHRMFQAAVPTDTSEEVIRRARLLLRPEERALLDDEEQALSGAASTYVALAARGEVMAILASGTCDYEMPFSVSMDAIAADGGSRSPGVPEQIILRGTIDCLVRRADGSVIVLEFKTGRARAEHQRQLEIYLSAVRTMFPGSEVTGAIMYP